MVCIGFSQILFVMSMAVFVLLCDSYSLVIIHYVFNLVEINIYKQVVEIIIYLINTPRYVRYLIIICIADIVFS